jgi:hypothetical protein
MSYYINITIAAQFCWKMQNTDTTKKTVDNTQSKYHHKFAIDIYMEQGNKPKRH